MANYYGVASDTPEPVKLNMKGSGSTAISAMYHYSKALSPTSVAANTAVEQTFAVPGVAVGDVVFVNKPAQQTGLGVAGCRVSAANTLAITFVNATASPIVPTAGETYQIGGIRR